MKNKEKERAVQTPAVNERFCVMAAETRRNGSAILEVSRPREPQWKPPLRQAAQAVVAMQGQCVLEIKL